VLKQSPSKANAPKRRFFALRLLFALGALAILVTWLHPKELFEAMRKPGIALWAFTVAAASFFHVILAAKWRILLRAAGNRTGLMETLRAHCAGLFANMYLPSIVGGDVVRMSLVAKDRSKLAATVTGIAADRVTDVISLVLLATAGLWLMPSQIGVEVRILGITSSVLCLVLAGSAAAICWVNPERFPTRIARAIVDLRQAFYAMSKRKSAPLLAVLAAVTVQGFFIFQNILIGNAIGIRIPAAVWFVAWPLAKLVSLLPVSIGGLGVREGVLIAMFTPFAVPPTLAVAESLVWQTVMYAVSLVGGLIAILIGGSKAHRHDPLSIETGETLDCS
jgi:glycosyltransferase 2 family protein